MGAPRIENKEGDTVVCELLFAERNTQGAKLKLRPMPAGFSFNLAAKFPTFATDQLINPELVRIFNAVAT